MSTLLSVASKIETQFARDVREGLTQRGQKRLPPTYFYDAIGSALFETITLLPEYGLTRADARVIERCAPELRDLLPGRRRVAELGSGSGKKTAAVLRATDARLYYPIDVSDSALSACERELSAYAEVRAIHASYVDGLRQVVAEREDSSLLVLFLGSTIGNFGHDEAVEFLRGVRKTLGRGDALLIGADVMADIDRLLLAYDDPLGVTAAFNLNVLARINRELGGRFDLRRFRHQVRWNDRERAVEMHLASIGDQVIEITGADCRAVFADGETIWTESSHKYELAALDRLAEETGFSPVRNWIDSEWPFAECLWTT